MTDCENFENSIEALIAGNPQLDQLEELVGHCKTCRNCRELFEMHRTLTHLGSKFDELENADLEGIRKTVVQIVASKKRLRFLSRWKAVLWTPFTLRPMVAVVLIAVVFVLGVVGNRFIDRPPVQVREITDEALSHVSLSGMENSPYSFSNVAVKELNNNRISLAFDVTKHVEIVEPANSERVKKILMNSLLNPTHTGAVGHFQDKPVKGTFFY